MVGGQQFNNIVHLLRSEAVGEQTKPSVLVNEISKRKVHGWFIRGTQTLRESVPDNSTLDS
jgi:hypothetical protein